MAEDPTKYSNSKSYAMVSNMERTSTFVIYLFALMYLASDVGKLAAFGIMFLFLFIKRVKNATIYFFYDGGLGPDWKQQLAEDLAHTFRDCLVFYGAASLLWWIESICK